MARHEAMLKTQSDVPGTKSLKAAWATVMHRASTPKGPIKDRAMRGNQKTAGRPILPKKVLVHPLNRHMAKTPRKGTRTPVRKIPRAPRLKCPWLVFPTTRGNTRFPEPKNIENSARPVDITKRFFFIRGNYREKEG